ncbi:MAG: stage II sporulation protein R [Lachnospiraceae bacterium]|nr:stage II sporulation protein R [Lachnospiraceae bacterium]
MKKKAVLLAVCAAFAILVTVLPTPGEAAVRERVIRLHVVANSDGEEDQALKLAVRDALTGEVASMLEGVSTKEEAEKVLSDRLDGILACAEKAAGDVPVTVTLGKERYPTKEYGAFRFPRGVYTSVQVKLGAAEGKNWWCVLFPPLCVGAASAGPEEVCVEAGLTPGQVKILTGSDGKYRVRFRVLEWLDALFGG